jgi:hypothetical protein
MGQQERHATSGTARKVRRVAAVLLATGVLVSLGSAQALADVLEDVPSGQENTEQDGAQNLDCGNSARLVRLNVAETDRRKKVCVDTDGHVHRHSRHESGAEAIGDTTIGPQVNTAQTGKQNLNCGNSADLVTVNVAGTMRWDTTCTATDHGGQHRRGGYQQGAHSDRARALGGTTVGPQVNTAQTGRQNLNCGNSSDTLTVNVMGTIRKSATCTAADYSASRPGKTYRGRASADAGQVVGPETNTAQNGRQNQTCGSPGPGLEVPLGETEHRARCTVYHGT